VVDHSPQSSSRSQQVVTEAASKHNTGNQSTPQQQITPSPVKDSNHTKVSPTNSQTFSSDQAQHRLVQLEESLKEKTGLLPLRLSDPHSDATVSEGQLSGLLPLRLSDPHSDATVSEGQLSVNLHLEDSNVPAPSEELSEDGSVYNVVKESDRREPPSGLNQQQTATEEGMLTY
jgi:hypothetical protein